MKKLVILFFVAMLTSSCAEMNYPSAPMQNLPEISTSKGSVLITIINKSGSNVEFYRGNLKGLILSPWEQYTTRFSLGYQKHSWSHVALYNNNIYHYSGEIIVTHKSKRLIIYPPREDTMFRTSGQGSIELKDY